MRNLFVLEEKIIFRTLFLLTVLWTLSLPTAAQEKSDNLTLTCQDEPLPEVLKRVEELSGFKVLFTYNEVQEFKVTVSVKNASIKELLDSILSDFTPPLTIASEATPLPSHATQGNRCARLPALS